MSQRMALLQTFGSRLWCVVAALVFREEASMCDRLNEVLASARAVVASLDVESLTPAQAANWFQDSAELEKVAAAIKLVVAPKIAQSDAWTKAGHRSPEDWMARQSGSSVGKAKNTVETAKRLSQLPDTEAAVKSGSLSLDQAAAVSEAATADPSAEKNLLEAAGTESLKELQRRSRRTVLDAQGSVEERYARQHRLRSFRSWIDEDGMTAGQFRLTPEVGAAVVTKIRAEADRHFRKANKQGRRESPENYAADALAGLVTGEALIGAKAGSKGAEVVVVVSRDSLLRDEVGADAGELCEVPGFGAIPVSRARELMSDCFLKGVIYDGKQITHVRHFGRHRPAEVDTALLARSVLDQGQVICIVEGCDQTAHIQWDHAQPHALGGPTSEANLNPMCGFHNRAKEAGRVIKAADGRWVRTATVAQTRNPP